jgi:arginase family enzyme
VASLPIDMSVVTGPFGRRVEGHSSFFSWVGRYLSRFETQPQCRDVPTTESMVWQLVSALALHLVSVPYDAGANRPGAARATDFMWPRLRRRVTDHVRIGAAHPVAVMDELREVLAPLLDTSVVPVVLGGDHTVAAGSVGASYAHCRARNASLGVLWIDAHADVNTLETSPTPNLHGMPVAVLCGHTLPALR